LSFQVGQVVEGKVVKITNFGAFVELDDGTQGLIHISQISRNYVKNVSDYLRVGEVVKAKVREVKGNGKVDLSIKELENEKSRPTTRVRKGSNPDFEQMLRSYLRASEENQSDLKRRRDGKRW
jgi:S1 RNA binding domain protein